VLDNARLQALHRSGVLSPDGGEFDRITRIAARMLGVRVALVSFVDHDRQVFRGCTGLPEPWATGRESPLTHSFCQHVVDSDAPLVVEDARLHPVLRDNLAVPELGVVGYLGVPVRAPHGEPLGALCVIDGQPRQWTAEEAALLEDLAATVSREVELRTELAVRRDEVADAQVLRTVVDTMQLGVTITEMDGRILYANDAEAALHGYAPGELVGQAARVLAPPALWGASAAAPREATRWSRQSVNVRRDGTEFPVALWSDAVRDSEGVPRAWVTCCQDLSEREAQARALHESQERLKGIVDSAMDAIVAVDEERRVLVFNGSAERMFRCTARAALGTPLERFLPGAEGALEAGQITSRGMRDPALLRGVRSSGEGFPAEATFSRAEVDGGWVYTAIVRDVTERTEAENEVAELVAREMAARERVSKILESITDAFFALDPEWRFTYVNGAAEALFRRRRDELLEASIWHALPELAATALALEMRRAARDGGARAVEVFYEPLQKWLQVHAYPTAEGVSLYVQDVTERRQALEALRLSEERFRTALQSGHVIVLNQDRDLRVTWMHGPAAFDLGEMVGKTDDEWHQDPADAAAATAIKRRVLATGVGERAETRMRIGGADFYFHLVVEPLRDADDAVVGITCAALDITERKAQAEELARSELLLRSVLEGIQDVIYLKDLEGRYVLANQAVARLLGHEPAELLGRRARELFGAEAAAGIERTDAALLAGAPEPVEAEEVHTVEGRTRVFATHKAVLRDADGRPAGILGVTRDVTEQRSLEAQARQSQKMEAVGRLAGGIAHDFNNLLMVIGGYSRLLLGRAGAEGAQELEEIRNAADRAATLTQQLLAFSRRQVMRSRRMDLGAVLADMQGMLRRLLGEHVAVEARAERGTWHVEADPAHVEQIVMNLAVNARDAMPDGGRLRLELGSLVAGEREAPAGLRPGRYVRLTVADDGRGMDADTLAQAFEPFFTTKGVGEGTGLGLSTVYGIVKQSGGSVWAESVEGAGTRVHVCLPEAPPLAPAAPPPPAAPVRRATGTVLLAEDEPAVRALVAASLRAVGLDVIACPDAEEALRVALEGPDAFQVLLTDVVMPGMSGHELARRVRTAGIGVPVLYMSGYPGEEVARRGVDEGAGYLAKPVSPEELVRRVCALVEAVEAAVV
jgi:PAS domain S-box-containing protein